MPQTLLLVDDELNILRSLKRTLHEDGYQIYTAASGEKALDILSKEPVQVIISDQRMPNMSGAEFLAKASKLYPHTIRVILSSYTDFESLKDAINNGAIYKFMNKPWNDDMLRQVIREAFQLFDQRSENERRLTWSLDHDNLTGLPNHFLFTQAVTQAISHARAARRVIALISLNINRFNQINAVLGEGEGDQILQFVAERLKIWTKCDANATRLGNKFYFFLEDASRSTIENFIKNAINELNQPLKASSIDFHLSVSMGISYFPDHSEECDALIKHANDALIYGKKIISNGYQVYGPEMAYRQKELFSEAEVYEAIEKNQFVVYFQPIIMAQTGQIKGAETLIRWQHPKHGLLMPDQFIPFCEETGLIIPVGTWALNAACQQLKKWRDKGHDVFMAVNVSPRQLRHESMLDTINHVLELTKIPHHCLELEITESVMMHDIDTNIDVMKKLKNLSLRLSIDDFGTGYSSLSYLKHLPIHTLKIDKSFIKDIGIIKNNIEILNTIISLAKKLGLILIAEGVETKEQLDILKIKDCDLIQGYFYSRPVSADECELLMDEKIIRK